MILEKLKSAGSFLLRLHDFICDAFAHALAWLTLAMTLGIGYEICMRYFFIRPTKWAVDFTNYTLLYITFLGAAWLAKHDGHVELTFVLDRLSSRTRGVMKAINSLFCALVCVFVIWYGAKDAWDAFARGTLVVGPLPIPKYPLVAVIPVGCFLLLVQFIRNAHRFLRSAKDTPQAPAL